MVKVVYEVVPHDGGWAYKLGDVYSEAFPTHPEALEAARIVAAEQQVGGDSAEISWQDDQGQMARGICRRRRSAGDPKWSMDTGSIRSADVSPRA